MSEFVTQEIDGLEVRFDLATGRECSRVALRLVKEIAPVLAILAMAKNAEQKTISAADLEPIIKALPDMLKDETLDYVENVLLRNGRCLVSNVEYDKAQKGLLKGKGWLCTRILWGAIGANCGDFFHAIPGLANARSVLEKAIGDQKIG